MKLAPILRGARWLLVAAWAGLPGCIHNHYYGSLPGCPPGVPGVTTQIGSVCEVPGGQTIVSSGGMSSGVVVQPSREAAAPIVSGMPNPQRIVISQPAYGPSFGQGLGRFNRWRRPDPEGVATIRTEGGLDDGMTIQR